MTGLSKHGDCKNSSGYFHLSLSISYIFCSEFKCTFLLYVRFMLPAKEESVISALNKKNDSDTVLHTAASYNWNKRYMCC